MGAPDMSDHENKVLQIISRHKPTVLQAAEILDWAESKRDEFWAWVDIHKTLQERSQKAFDIYYLCADLGIPEPEPMLEPKEYLL